MTSCTYDGKEYSNGSYSCQAGIRMRCDDGKWTDTGNTCSEFNQDDTTSSVADTSATDDKRQKEQLQSSVKNGCGVFGGSTPNDAQLGNKCDDRMEFKVDSYRSGNIFNSRIFHLRGHMGRPIQFYGDLMRISHEGPWKTGNSGSSYLRMVVTNEQGGKLWTAHNRNGAHYLAVACDVYKAGKKSGEVWDVIKPGNYSRFWWFYPNQVGYLSETFCFIEPK